MDAKEAKNAIVAHDNGECGECFEGNCCDEAQGYLACLEGPEVKELFKRAAEVSDLFGCQNPAETYEDQFQDCGACSGCNLKNALALYKESIKNSGKEVG